jgi:hypothetical protein
MPQALYEHMNNKGKKNTIFHLLPQIKFVFFFDLLSETELFKLQHPGSLPVASGWLLPIGVLFSYPSSTLYSIPALL